MSKLSYIVIVALLAIGIGLAVGSAAEDSASIASQYLHVDEEGTQDLVAEVAPAVVSIVTESVSHNWFWQAVPQIGAGSGIVVSPDGYIVTNNHVVEDAQKVTVTLSDGSALEATIIGRDASATLWSNSVCLTRWLLWAMLWLCREVLPGPQV